MLDKYELDYAIYLDLDLIRRPNDLQRTVVSYFVRNPGWKLVFWDDKSMLFLKDVPGFAAVISKYEYRVMNPYVALFSVAEFEKLAKNDPARTKEGAKRKKLTEPGGFLFRGMN